MPQRVEKVSRPIFLGCHIFRDSKHTDLRLRNSGGYLVTSQTDLNACDRGERLLANHNCMTLLALEPFGKDFKRKDETVKRIPSGYSKQVRDG
jgi:hypothetical protein